MVRMSFQTSWFRSVSLLLLVPLLAMAGLNLASSVRAQDAPTITMWFNTTGGSETAECMIAKAIDPFNAQGGPQVEATLQADNWTATRTALAGGAGPDVVTTPGPSFSYELGEAGQVIPLDEYATQYGWADTFIPWALDLGRVNGQLYSIPTEIETLVLYYNETLFQEKGWTVPTTLPELMALAETIAADGIIPFAHTNAEWRPTNEWFVGEFMNHHAGPEKVYQALTGEAQWTDPAFVEALTMLDQMQQNGWFMGGLDRYYTTPTVDAAALLSEGEAAMKIEGTWFVGDALTFFPEVEQEWNWAPVPSATGDAIYDLGIGSTYSINANSEYPAETAEFISYLFSPEVQATLAVECSLAPAPVTIPPESLAGLDERYAAILASMNEAAAANNYGYTTWTLWPPQSDLYIYEEIEKVWAGDMTVEEYLQGLQTTFDQEVAEGAVVPVPAR
jgi:raffinose/stachyose/melibiose transport system substrate-binding protein